jgi:hypothetical protein
MSSEFELLSKFFECSRVEQANVYGRLIPSIPSFVSLISTLPNEASRNEFIRRNNLWVHDCPFKYHPENCSSTDIELNKIRDLSVELLRIEKRQADLSGINFPEYVQSKAVVAWFLDLWGNHLWGSLQRIIRGEELEKIQTNRLRPYPEYVIAEKYVDDFDDLVSAPYFGGSEAWDLVKERKKVFKQLARAIENRKPNIRNKHGAFKYSWVCICGKYISIDKGKTCGSPKCLDVHKKNGQNDRQEKSRAERVPVANPQQKLFRQSERTKCSRCKGRKLWYLTRELLCRECEADRITS